MNEFKIGERVEYVKDMTEELNGESHPTVPIGSVGMVMSTTVWYDGDTFRIGVLFPYEDQTSYFFFPEELASVDRPHVNELESAQSAYLSALSTMTTARKQLADLSLDRYLTPEVRDALMERLDTTIAKAGDKAEEAIEQMKEALQ